jgi:hypothetical protein
VADKAAVPKIIWIFGCYSAAVSAHFSYFASVVPDLIYLFAFFSACYPAMNKIMLHLT